MDKNRITALALQILPSRLSLAVARLHPGIARNLPAGIQTTINYYNRFTVEVDTSYPIERDMITGEYDPPVTRAMERLISTGDIVIDIGANIGALSLVASSLVGDTGKVISIEPGPLTHDRFNRTIQSNNIQNIILIQIGISDSEGELMWNMDPDNLGNASLSLSAQGVRVPVTTLDKLLSEHSLSKIDVIKIDVEGMELQVFQGSLLTLEHFKPSLIFETMDAWKTAKGPGYFDEIGRLLSGLGYKFFNIDSNNFHEVKIEDTGDNTLAVWKDRASHMSAITA